MKRYCSCRNLANWLLLTLFGIMPTIMPTMSVVAIILLFRALAVTNWFPFNFPFNVNTIAKITYISVYVYVSGADITAMGEQLGYEREVVRIWFCNKRQALKNTVRMMAKAPPSHSHSHSHHLPSPHTSLN